MSDIRVLEVDFATAPTLGDIIRFDGTNFAPKSVGHQLISNSSAVLINTTSTSYVDTPNTNCSITIPTGETWLVDYDVQFHHSHSVASIYAFFALNRDASQLREMQLYETVATASGYPAFHHFRVREVLTAGTYVYKMQWKIASGIEYMGSRWAQLTGRRTQ